MGAPVPAGKGVEPYFRNVGFVGMLFLGLGILFGVISYYIDFGYAISSGPSMPGYILAFLGLGIVAATFLLVISVLTIIAGARGRGGIFPRRSVVLILFLAALAFILNGAANLAFYSGINGAFSPYGSLLDSGVVSIVAGVVLLIGILLSGAASMVAKVIGAFFALGFGVMATIQVYYGLYGYLYAVSGFSPSNVSFAFGFNDISSLFNPLGLLDWGYLVAIAFIIGAVGLLVHAFLGKGRAVAASYVVALVGALIFAIGLIWDSLSQLTAGYFWPFVTNNLTQGVVPAIAEFFFAFAGFILLAASGLGIAAQAQSLVGPMIAGQATAPPRAGVSAQPQGAASVQYCPKCGAQNEAESAFCKKCGAKRG